MARSQQALALNYKGMSEPELIGFARQGHQDAFRVIMQRNNQRLFRIARGVVRDDVEAEDVLQEAYTRAFEKLDGFREESSLFTWLTSVTLNEARGRLRKRRTTVGVEAIEAAQKSGAQIIMLNSASAAESPENNAARSQMRLLIEQAVDELPEPFRIVFIMREIEECSVEETAANLDLRPETVKTRLHRARRLLREALNERVASAVTEAFPFLGALCARLTAKVLARLAPRYGWHAEPAEDGMKIPPSSSG
ncbi:MAG: RNA polymerase sigma factor [Pseudomonadota bacterium]|nr:RNA polymerase sigma factor [Pseudomonadota bacterium]